MPKNVFSESYLNLCQLGKQTCDVSEIKLRNETYGTVLIDGKRAEQGEHVSVTFIYSVQLVIVTLQ